MSSFGDGQVLSICQHLLLPRSKRAIEISSFRKEATQAMLCGFGDLFMLEILPDAAAASHSNAEVAGSTASEALGLVPGAAPWTSLLEIHLQGVAARSARQSVDLASTAHFRGRSNETDA